MYKIVEAEEIVRIDPSRFGEPLEKIILSELRERYEGTVSKELNGIIVFITKLKEIGDGEIFIGDGAPYYKVKFEAIVFTIENREVYKGIIVDVAPFGAFVNIGSFAGLLHVSQISGESLTFDEKNKCFISEKSKERYGVDDLVLVRVIGVSLGSTTKDTKIGLTMRQPGLGKIGEKK